MPPTVLLETLQAIGRKVRLYALALGAGRVIAAAVGLLLAAVFVDWAVHATTLSPGGLPGPARLILDLAILAGVVSLVIRWLAKPLMRRYAPGDVAGWIEERYPEFGDSLRSTVNFISGDVPGSPALKQRVVDQAAEKVQGTNLDSVIDPKPVWYASGGAVFSVATLVVLAVLMPTARRVAGSWLLHPLDGAQWPRTVQIALDQPPPARVPVGEVVPVRVKLVKGDSPSRKAIIRYRYDNGAWHEETMERGSDGIYTASLDTRLDQSKPSASLQVQIQAGDDEKIVNPITIVPRLDLTLAEADVTPPAYVHAAQQSKVNLSERPAVMAVGSDVAVQLRFNKPLASEKPIELQSVKPGQKLPPIKWDRPSDTLAVAHFPATESLRFTVHATDTDHFQNAGASEYELIVREDQLPTVQIEEPRRSEERTAVAAFNLKAVAEDDYGVQDAQLVVQRLSGPTTRPAAGAPSASNKWVIDLVKNDVPADPNVGWQAAGGTLERKRFELAYDWDLAKLANANLTPGDVLEYFVQVKDNYNLNGKEHPWVPSGRLRITIISQEQLATAAQQAFEVLHSELKELQQGQVRNKTETDSLRQMTEKKPAFDKADQAQAERLASQQSMAASQTMQAAQKLQALSQRLKENKATDTSLQQISENVRQQLQNTAEGVMKQASENLNDARDQKPDPKASPAAQKQQEQQRNQTMAKASENQQQAADQLRQAMDRLGNFDGLQEFRQKLQDIKDRQEKVADKFDKLVKDDLGKKPEDLSKQKQDELKKLSDQQKDLSKQTQNAVEQMNKKAEQMAKSDPNSSQAMKSAAQTGNQQQVPGKQQQSAQAMQQNQQAQAQQAQKQVDIGLEMMIAKLKEAERRKLEELQTKLAELQQLVNDLVRRQANHNLDNLILQGNDKLARMDLADRAALYVHAQRDDKAAPLSGTIRDLNTSQRVTERNTRDVARKAEQLPDPAPSAKLTVAAGHMERAIVHLNNEKLADAYDPPQVDALATLIDAQKLVDEALRKVQDKLKQETRDSIRQAYVKLLADQKKVGKDIKDVDSTPKDNGALPRPVAIRLGQLPGDQGKLSDRATKIGSDLEQLGSIVYVWANKDIVKTMDGVKDDLAKPETGVPTQAEETRIEEQLQAMIDSLKVNPRQSKFNQRNAGGGGGQGTPKVRMPSEAELRLLKSVQQAVNKSTQTIDAQPNKDKPKLLALGGRQGELRTLLDQMVQKASGGKVKLGPEPDNRDQLPEEAKKEDVEDQEFDKQLLNDKLTDDQAVNNVKLTGDRMARSRQRLALNDDPGKVTQEIQKRIVIDLDNMIKLAQAQQAQMVPGNGKPQPGQGPPQPQPGQQRGQQQVAQRPGQQRGGTTPAAQSTLNQGQNPQADLSQEIKERAQEWGQLHPRLRDAILEGASEKMNPKYQKLVEDYYKTLSEKATER